MKTFVLAVVLVLVGCGLEDYEYLPAPLLPRYLDQNDFTKLSFTHEPAAFVGTNFLGYEFYYRIYPWSNGARDHLITDAGTLKTSGLAALESVGYRRLNLARFTSGIPLLEFTPDSGVQTITLDFSTFLSERYAQGINASPPEFVIKGSNGEVRQTVFRNSSAVEPQYTYFNSLLESTSSPIATVPDFAKTVTESVTEYEVLVFVMSYSVSDLLVSSLSPPVPWGIIGPIKKAP